MPGIMQGVAGGMPMPGISSLIGHTQPNQSQQGEVAMPPLMGMPQLAGMPGHMHPGLLMQLGLLGGMPNMQ